MLLILATALFSLYAKRTYSVILFAIITHTALGVIVVRFGTISRVEGIILSAIASIVVGLITYTWKWWYMRKRTEYIGLRKLKTILTVLVAILLCINVLLVYYGIKDGQELVAQAKDHMAESSSQTKNVESNRAQ